MALLLLAPRVWGQAPTWQWAVGAHTPNTYAAVICSATVVDPAGDIVVAGQFRDTIRVGTTTLISNAQTISRDDVFVGKLSATGTYLWAARADGAGFDHVTDVAVDGSGNIYVAGSFDGPTLTLGATTLTNHHAATTQDGTDGFVAKLSPAGVWQWAVNNGTTDHDVCKSIAVDNSGNVYVAGYFLNPPLTFGTTTLTTRGSYVARLSSTGVWQWAVQATGPNQVYNRALAVDSRGDVVVSGNFQGSVTFGATTLTSPTASVFDNEAFVAKLSPAGVWQWAASGGGPGDDDARTLAVGGHDEIFVSGYAGNATATFGAISQPTGVGLYNKVFVAKLNAAGAWQWVATAGGVFNNLTYGLAADDSSNVYVTGSCSDSAAFGAFAFTNGCQDCGYAAYTAKLNAAGAWQWAQVNEEAQGQAVAVGPRGQVVATGVFNSSITLGTTTLDSLAGHFFVGSLRQRPLALTGEQALRSFRLTPNPAHETVHLTGSTAPTAAILDALGRTVRTANLTPGASVLNLRGLPAGFYTVRAGSAARRLVVE